MKTASTWHPQQGVMQQTMVGMGWVGRWEDGQNPQHRPGPQPPPKSSSPAPSCPEQGCPPRPTIDGTFPSSHPALEPVIDGGGGELCSVLLAHFGRFDTDNLSHLATRPQGEGKKQQKAQPHDNYYVQMHFILVGPGVNGDVLIPKHRNF